MVVQFANQAMTPEALGNIEKPVTREEVERDYPIVAEFLDYIRWLAEQDTSFALSAGALWTLYYHGVQRCQSWDEVCEECGLPVRDDWN